MSFICIIIKTHFHINGFALSLALKVRFFGTRKWPIQEAGSHVITGMISDALSPQGTCDGVRGYFHQDCVTVKVNES